MEYLSSQNGLIKFHCVLPTMSRSNKMHSTILVCATDDLLMIFKNLEKCDISKMCKTFIQSKISSIWCFFKSARPVCNRLHFKSINYTQNPFSSKRSIFAFLTQKLQSERQLFRNTAEGLPIKMHIFRQKFIFNFISSWSERNEFEK